MIPSCGLPIADQAARAVNRRVWREHLTTVAQITVLLALVVFCAWTGFGK